MFLKLSAVLQKSVRDDEGLKFRENLRYESLFCFCRIRLVLAQLLRYSTKSDTNLENRHYLKAIDQLLTAFVHSEVHQIDEDLNFL